MAQEVLSRFLSEGRGSRLAVARPLYTGAASARRATDGHAGLWFDKFCDRWQINGSHWSMKGDSNSKLEWIKTVTDRTVGTQDQIDEYASRLLRMVDRQSGRWEVYVTESRFVTGLGRSHPVENGFAWHPTLGTPYLPGSSVKGLIHAWAKTGAGNMDRTRCNRVFGDIGAAGAVCFLDAVPTAPVKLVADVMTPHYAGWSSDDPPGDWRSPVPIPFLVTDTSTTFLFGFVPSRRTDTTTDDLNAVAEWLRSALEWAGAGAKTSVGYGRMGLDPDVRMRLEKKEAARQKEWEQQRALQSARENLPKDAAKIEEMIMSGAWSDRNPFLDAAESFLSDKQRLSKAAYERIKKQISDYWPGILENPDAVQGKRKKPKYRPRPQDLARKLLSMEIEGD